MMWKLQTIEARDHLTKCTWGFTISPSQTDGWRRRKKWHAKADPNGVRFQVIYQALCVQSMWSLFLKRWKVSRKRKISVCQSTLCIVRHLSLSDVWSLYQVDPYKGFGKWNLRKCNLLCYLANLQHAASAKNKWLHFAALHHHEIWVGDQYALELRLF